MTGGWARMAKRAEPPPGRPWGDPLDGAPLVFVDCEVTGLRPCTDRVGERGAGGVRGDAVVARIETLVLPESRATGNLHVHGIDAVALTGAPSFAAIADRVLEVLGGGVLVAHAASWDVAFIEAELARAG